MTTERDPLFEASGAALKFEDEGDRYVLRIEDYVTRQATDFQTGLPLTDAKGAPVMETVFSGKCDGEDRRIFATGSLYYEIKTALVSSSIRSREQLIGSKLDITFTERVPAKDPRFKRKTWAIKIIPAPAPTAVVDEDLI